MKRRICALILALCLAFVCLADATLDDFAAVYNEYATQNGAEQMDTSSAEHDEDGWYVTFPAGYSLCIAFEATGEVDLLMLETEAGTEGADKAFLNAWYCADAELEYEGIAEVIGQMLAGRDSVTTMYMGWYVAYEYIDAAQSGTGTAWQYVGAVWVGEEAGSLLPSASATPAPETPKQNDTPETVNGKTVYKI